MADSPPPKASWGSLAPGPLAGRPVTTPTLPPSWAWGQVTFKNLGWGRWSGSPSWPEEAGPAPPAPGPRPGHPEWPPRGGARALPHLGPQLLPSRWGGEGAVGSLSPAWGERPEQLVCWDLDTRISPYPWPGPPSAGASPSRSQAGTSLTRVLSAGPSLGLFVQHPLIFPQWGGTWGPLVWGRPLAAPQSPQSQGIPFLPIFPGQPPGQTREGRLCPGPQVTRDPIGAPAPGPAQPGMPPPRASKCHLVLTPLRGNSLPSLQPKSGAERSPPGKKRQETTATATTVPDLPPWAGWSLRLDDGPASASFSRTSRPARACAPGWPVTPGLPAPFPHPCPARRQGPADSEVPAPMGLRTSEKASA